MNLRKNRIFTAALFVTLICSVPDVNAGDESSRTAATKVESNVVQVTVHSSAPDLTSPWQKLGVESGSGSGVILEDGRILTNAHVVDYAVNIEVQRADRSKPYPARVEFVGHDCDLALVRVDDEDFFDGAEGLGLGKLPDLRDEVQVFGFPVGGDTLSITSGILSRIEVSLYAHFLEELLLAQIDAPINSGNSGGPVLANGSVVGIASQTLEEAENVGYMIPLPVIRRFLDDVADGSYDGLPDVGAEFQPLESAAQRRSLGMGDEQTGVLVLRVDHGGPAATVLRSKDVVVSIDGHAISNEGTVELPGLGKVLFTHVFQSKQIGDDVALEILRDGKPASVSAQLTPHRALVPYRGIRDEPEYLVFGGLVFQPLIMEYLGFFEEMPVDLQYPTFHANVVGAERAQVILLQKVLPHGVNRGFQDWEDEIVESINGVVPRDMKQLAEIIDGAEGPWLEVALEDGSYLTIGLPEARAANKGILAGFGVPKDRSSGLVTGR